VRSVSSLSSLLDELLELQFIYCLIVVRELSHLLPSLLPLFPVRISVWAKASKRLLVSFLRLIQSFGSLLLGNHKASLLVASTVGNGLSEMLRGLGVPFDQFLLLDLLHVVNVVLHYAHWDGWEGHFLLSFAYVRQGPGVSLLVIDLIETFLL